MYKIRIFVQKFHSKIWTSNCPNYYFSKLFSTRFSGRLLKSAVLMAADINVMSHAYCSDIANRFSRNKRLKERYSVSEDYSFCAGTESGIQDTCKVYFWSHVDFFFNCLNFQLFEPFLVRGTSFNANMF